MLFNIIKTYARTPIYVKYIKHGQTIVIILTILHAIVLLTIAYPSFILFYICMVVIDPSLTIKATGMQ